MLSHSISSLVLCSLLSLVIILLKENDGSTVANKIPAMNTLRRKQRNIEGINWDSHHQQQSYQHEQNCMTKYPPIRNGDVNVYLVIPRLQKPVTKCPAPPEWPTTQTTTPTTTSPKVIAQIVFPNFAQRKTCREKFIRLGDKCYHFSDKKEKWFHAHLFCPAIGGDFAHPNQTENRRLKNHLSKLNRSENWWIGGHDRFSKGQYMWAHVNAKITFFDWDNGTVNDQESLKKDCILMKSKDFKWNVENCVYRFRYICEHSLNFSLKNLP